MSFLETPYQKDQIQEVFETKITFKSYSFLVQIGVLSNELSIIVKDLDPTNIPCFSYQKKYSMNSLIEKSKIFKTFDSVGEIPSLLKQIFENQKYSISRDINFVYLKIYALNFINEEEITFELDRINLDQNSVLNELGFGISTINKKVFDYQKQVEEIKLFSVDVKKELNDLKQEIQVLVNETKNSALNLDKITKERDSLKQINLDLEKKLEKMKKEIEKISNEKDKFKVAVTNLESITKERDELQKTVTTLTNEKNKINTNLTNITKERDTLKGTVTTLTNEKNTISTNLTNITKERDTLKGTVTTLTNEKNTINTNLTNITKERDTLKINVANLTKERDALKAGKK